MLIKAPQVTILLSCQDEKGVLRYPHDQQAYFGFTKRLDQSESISRQLVEFAARALGRPELAPNIEPLSSLEPLLKEELQDPSLLYVMRLKPDHFIAPQSWPTLIDVLRKMPQGRNRVAYNKALQYFAGVHSAQVDVLELDKEVAERLRHLSSAGSENMLSSD